MPIATDYELYCNSKRLIWVYKCTINLCVLLMIYNRTGIVWYMYVTIILICAYCSWWCIILAFKTPDMGFLVIALTSSYCNWWNILEIKSLIWVCNFNVNQCVLQLIINYIRNRNAWYEYVIITLICVYRSWWWIILEFNTPDIVMIL